MSEPDPHVLVARKGSTVVHEERVAARSKFEVRRPLWTRYPDDRHEYHFVVVSPDDPDKGSVLRGWRDDLEEAGIIELRDP